ncbi:hypothetical protein ACFOEE_05205 [Pseudoalteromonas fenneropenaei]|uniref:Solute-binding protein family 3/N-terminal domain-containing protein n=1 Tax=Pseudoalteromonas fenneropenaei TaxID=1737459 RepID=A0ABV7CH50_9GAMM
MLRQIIGVVLCLLPWFAAAQEPAQSEPLVVDIISSENFSQRYQTFLQGKNPLELNDFHPITQGSHIELVEMVLLQQALYLGGETRKVEFRAKPSVNLMEYSDLIAGDSLLLARSVWHEDIINYSGSLYISEPVVRVGEYEAGLYVSKLNVALHDLPAERLDQISVVANPRWQVDWHALNNIKLNIISFIGPWETMLDMVENQIADAMLVNFSVSENLTMTFLDRDYVPINNLKVLLPDSRHFVVSKRHPDGARVYAALNKGLHILRERGVIERALRQSGFINSRVMHWQAINQHMLPTTLWGHK